ncbi:hypothetical protein [Aquimarina muelleri]|uniref:Uncharacterized protein n=1 Tax=Aquimarina muelleri TaxID=279356 RepID=A0A918N4I9_9FLAO|nr:hypothetical protein [Aquimarina muelleri]MCX2764425.1 hypothetical protein [Aquimarina muelleri]GGX21250.1 hypothetical protein GCM10007384_23090 [Aquimarina muelleri]
MKKKWYFGILIATLALLVVIQQQTVVPNQEIVLEFVDIEITSLEAQNAIAIVKKQLQSIGIKNTRVSEELKNGKLKITYYSDVDVEDIKKILSKERNVELDPIFYDNEDKDSFPLNENSKDYNLDVYEIQKSTELSSDFIGKYVLEIKNEQGEYSSSNTCNFISDVDESYIDRLVKVAQIVHANIAIAIDNASHNIPEVRAGPIS